MVVAKTHQLITRDRNKFWTNTQRHLSRQGA